MYHDVVVVIVYYVGCRRVVVLLLCGQLKSYHTGQKRGILLSCRLKALGGHKYTLNTNWFLENITTIAQEVITHIFI